MLCTPPALILSQDQTLEIMVSKRPGEGSIKSISSLIAHLLFFRVVFSLSELSRYFRTCCASYYLSLFNFQRSFRRFRKRPRYYTTFFLTCQYLFQNFFKFFSGFFKLVRSQYPNRSLFLREPLYITTFSPLCQEVFWNFSKKVEKGRPHAARIALVLTDAP